MNIRNIAIIALTAIMPVANVMAQSKNNVIDEVIWVVGDEAIYKSDVENLRQDYQAAGQRLPGDPYCVIPEQLAVQKLFLHQAALDSIEVTDAEVFEAVDARIEEFIDNQFGSIERMEMAFGKTQTQIRELLFDSERSKLLTQEVQRNMITGTKVTPAQVRNYFKSMPEDSLPYVPTRVEVEIFVRQPIVTQEEIDKVKDDLRSYTERINSGQMQFSSLAALYSEDPSSSKGGELGYASRGDYVPEFANVAFSLTDPKTVSKIVETEYGFHIIQLIDKRGDKINVRHILRKPRVSDEAIETCINFLDSVCAEIKNGDYTFEECVPYLSDDKDTRNNHGLMVYKNPMTMETRSRMELKELPTEVSRAVSGLAVGEMSKPFLMMNTQGKEVVAVAKLKNRINGHRATMADDYEELQNVMIDKLNGDKIEEWIKEKQKTTYIRINEDWRNCEFQYPGWVKE